MEFTSYIYQLAHECEMRGMHQKNFDIMVPEEILELCLNFLEVKYGYGSNSCPSTAST
jgi:hypothetical protein